MKIVRDRVTKKSLGSILTVNHHASLISCLLLGFGFVKYTTKEEVASDTLCIHTLFTIDG